jgi:glycosyltransferase involved in cell wall biosynthesis
VRVLLATDAFPPVCGGSGWSTYELAKQLRARGHDVLVLKVAAGKRGPDRESVFDEIPVIEQHVFAPDVPGVRNYFKNERLYPRVAGRIDQLIATHRIDLVHGQHVLSAPPSVIAARRARIPSVVTVRDYWPVCYRADLLHTSRNLSLCPGCLHAAGGHQAATRIGLVGFGEWLARKYLVANMASKVQTLLDASAVIAVSHVIAKDLVARAPELAHARIEIIPNPVDVRTLTGRPPTGRPLDAPYALYVGKLAVNKGTDLLLPAVQKAGLDWPLVIAGDGPDRPALEAAARGRDVHFLGWIDRDDTVRWLAHAGMLVFPSRGPESLSRVLIEASALGVPIAAMLTGGTADIIVDEVTGLLSSGGDELAQDIRRLRDDAALRERLGRAAAARALEIFDAETVAGRVEQLYTRVVAEHRP